MTPARGGRLNGHSQLSQAGGFQGRNDEITLSNPSSLDVVAISLWESKANAEAYNTNSYPEVLKTLARMIDGTPKVQTFEAVTSTFHNVAVTA